MRISVCAPRAVGGSIGAVYVLHVARLVVLIGGVGVTRALQQGFTNLLEFHLRQVHAGVGCAAIETYLLALGQRGFVVAGIARLLLRKRQRIAILHCRLACPRGRKG
jgi:hypothetical protein